MAAWISFDSVREKIAVRINSRERLLKYIMIQMNSEQLRQVQMTELEILLEIDRICKKCGIRYSIIAGTMLGAVRHKGFIPWDDDADVAMLRPEYEKFREACFTELDNNRFYFQDHVCTQGYRWGYGKLRRKDTLFLREYQEHMPYEQGIFVDVFPLDAVPDSHIGRTVMNAQCYMIRKSLWSKVGKIAASNRVKRLIYAVFDLIPEKCLLSALNRMISSAERIDSRWVRILTFPTPNREHGYRKEWYTGGENAVFEGYIFPGVSDADAYLRFKYGNYKEYPPIEQRKTHPVSALSLIETKAVMQGANTE